ncbi:glutamate receptor-like [Panulirus ornatus]|uniref:glutamate receptor-like n=1 Tax=Panulirus ornatus TaxID=150431 RepID=UPI003A84BCA3
MGGSAAVRAITRHTSLRNTIHMLCITVDNQKHLKSSVNTWLRKGSHEEGGIDMKVFRRCLYCNKGEMGIQQLVQRSNQSSPGHWDDIAIPETLQNFMGHRFKVVTLQYFPFIVYDQSTTDGDTLSPRDSLDVRILNTISAHLNFTYEMHEPWDGTWGVPMIGGNWSGIVGTLQHHKADFSLNLTPSATRMKVISHSRIYSYDPLLIVSLKPGPLPRRWALLRPFAGNLWMIIIPFTFVAGVIVWLLQRMWFWLSGYPYIRLDRALFYSWGVLLQEPVSYSSASVSDQVFVGWWLLSCLIISTAYRSSLVAHLSVQSKYLPINTFQDLLNHEGWSWGGFPLRGTTFLFFNQSTDAVIQEVYKNLQIYEVEKGMDQVMAEGFSYIAHEKRIRNYILPYYQDKYGNSLLHLSTTEYPVLGGNSWGMRQGAPFIGQIRMMKQLLIETGLIDHWMDDVIQIRAEHITQRSKAFEDKHSETEDGQVVLRLDHLQGTFYLLLLGYIVASITLLGERLALRHTGVHQSHIMG